MQALFSKRRSVQHFFFDAESNAGEVEGRRAVRARSVMCGQQMVLLFFPNSVC
jgi:hypothetical protein